MTSVEWWNSVKNDESKFNKWLQKQYYGELKASERVSELIKIYNLKSRDAKIIKTIAHQESQHADWILSLLKNRRIVPLKEHSERYWKETGLDFDNVDEAFAVAAHAEKMRLERIKAIVNDESAPKDVREIFTKILKDEQFHEEAFRTLTTPEQYEKSRNNHNKGLKSLGLTL